MRVEPWGVGGLGNRGLGGSRNLDIADINYIYGIRVFTRRLQTSPKSESEYQLVYEKTVELYGLTKLHAHQHTHLNPNRSCTL